MSTTVDELTRRGVLATGLSLAALLATWGDPAAAAGFPRTVETGLGPVRIPRAPERIVTLGTEADAVVALGQVPVAIAGGFPDRSTLDPWLVDPLGDTDVALLDLDAGVPFERIAAARPDVILAGTFLEVDEHYERLSEIAPTVTYRRGANLDTWQEQILLVGEALAAEEAAAAAVAGMEARIDELRPDFEGHTYSLSFYYEPSALSVVANPTDSAVEFFRSLGLALTPDVTALPLGDFGTAIIGLEQLAVLDADLLLMTYASAELRWALEANPLFIRLPAVADGRYLAVDVTVTTALVFPTVLRVEYALDKLVPEFTEALRG